MNYMVHGIMYSYFCLRAIKIKVNFVSTFPKYCCIFYTFSNTSLYFNHTKQSWTTTTTNSHHKIFKHIHITNTNVTSNFQIPEFLAKCITSLQSVQMLVGFTVNFYSIYKKLNGEECGNTYAHSFVAIVLYFSYFVLFLRFAQQRYSKPKAKTQ